MTRHQPIPAARADTVLRLARLRQFAMVGIAAARPSEHGDYLREWLRQGRHGTMDYLLEQIEERLDPRKLVPGARSVICVADVHPAAPEDGPLTQEPASPPEPAGKIARYAHGGDYHAIIKKRLHRLADDLRGYFPGHVYRSCVDTAPTLEREHALRAGLGWIGKNTLLIHPHLGSYFLLGEIITTLPLATAEDLGTAFADHCGACTRCLEACPTQCLEPYRMDASRCISYLTIEHRDRIDPSLQLLMGDWLAGCDACQEVCPFNQRASMSPASVHPAYTSGSPGPRLELLQVLGWDQDTRQKALFKSALKRIKLEQFKRNALIVAGNLLREKENVRLRDRIGELAGDPQESPLVRKTARQVLERCTGTG